MRRLIKTLAATGRDSAVWPVVLLLFAVVVPAICLLWFMNAAMRNERFAVRQRLAEAYRSHLAAAQARLEQNWNETTAELQRLARTTPASAAFASCVRAGEVDSVIICDEAGRVLYPNAPSGAVGLPGEPDPGPESERGWAEAGRLEYGRNDCRAAAGEYDKLARAATNVSVAARAFQAEARCLARSGQTAAAIRLIDETLSGAQYRQATDPQGRLIAANVELLALELDGDRAAPVGRAIAKRLEQRLTDYENTALASTQRRFLMKELRKHFGQTEFPTLAAEELAAQVCEQRPSVGPSSALRRSPVADVWQFTTADRRVVALLRPERLLARVQRQAQAKPGGLPADAKITLMPPEADTGAGLVALPAGPHWPGWRLTLSLKDQKQFDSATDHRSAVYLWTGLLVVGAMGALALLGVRLVRRQLVLARLKNDLAATVSHELKTPLASMRVFVDTLLDSETLNERTAREYLHLIAKENERLSRLIDNFLTFSRIERKDRTFRFRRLAAREILGDAVAAVRERFDAPGCRFEVRAEEDLPCVMADPDALATVLINLLDNAHKYTGDCKHIILRARVAGGSLVFSVEDNGLGIAPGETKRIFERFYQVDRRLSRQGDGCGLGLSIVQHIVTAHRGRVTVRSRPGSGSTFSVSIPALRQAQGTALGHAQGTARGQAQGGALGQAQGGPRPGGRPSPE